MAKSIYNCSPFLDNISDNYSLVDIYSFSQAKIIGTSQLLIKKLLSTRERIETIKTVLSKQILNDYELRLVSKIIFMGENYWQPNWDETGFDAAKQVVYKEGYSFISSTVKGTLETVKNKYKQAIVKPYFNTESRLGKTHYIVLEK